jgi:hypothetical protein
VLSGVGTVTTGDGVGVASRVGAGVTIVGVEGDAVGVTDGGLGVMDDGGCGVVVSPALVSLAEMIARCPKYPAKSNAPANGR